jgi:hypothetical protein
MRDLTGASPVEIAKERSRLPHEGLGAQILARQESDGSWRRPDRPLWLPTLFTLLLLRATGIDRNDPAVQSAVARLDSSLRWNNQPGWELRPANLGGNRFFEGEVEPCINGGVLALGAYFGHPAKTLAQRLLGEQLDDGGWNCEAPKSTRSSFHTTICVLEGLAEYERAVGSAPEVVAARLRGEQYLLERALFRRRSTGEIANPEFLQLAFPPRYHYDILRALDYFRASGAKPDPRMNEALQIVESKRQADGRWLLDRSYDEALALPFGESSGEPSRWNTLRALRVLRWCGRSQTERLARKATDFLSSFFHVALAFMPARVIEHARVLVGALHAAPHVRKINPSRAPLNEEPPHVNRH